ncbi:embryonic protein DC-8-like [Phragmites australis]|uniref:embryonic protein DC-8-like n=1 Tax=Phragmites australis TaxID=29695 RepID=UPI002D78CB9E|nr:embryonic protein DC-8-like [Phragmites australis]
MASMQKRREEHAQSAARKAANELAEARRDHREAAPVSPRGGGGILGSVQESARSILGAVRGTFSSDPRGDDSAPGGATATAGSYDDEGKGKAGGMADAATWKTAEAKDYAVEKKEGARQALAGDALGRKGETDESAWQQGQDVMRRAAEKAEEMQRAREPSEAEKGRSATENIYGKAKGAMGAFGEKMVMPEDVVEKKRAEAAGGGGRDQAAAPPPTMGSRGEDAAEDVMMRVKAADHMTGQAFNDVGMMGEEGTGMPRRR